MPIIRPTSDMITTGIALSVGNDDVTIDANITIQSLDSVGLYSTANQITTTIDGVVDGFLAGLYYNASPNTNFNYLVTIGATGVVRGQGTALYMGGTDPFTGVGILDITNRGLIESDLFNGASLFNFSSLTLVNSGTINSNATDAQYDAQAIYMSGGNATITNNGQITNSAQTSSTNFADLYLVAAISSVLGFGKQVGDTLTIENNSRIISSGTAIVSEGGDDTIINDGILIGDIWLFDGNDSIDNINDNDIRGNIDFGEGDNRLYTEDGSIDGNVTFGSGNDVLISDSSAIRGDVNMGDGDNIVDSDDRIVGALTFGSGADTLTFTSLVDSISMGAGNDSFTGSVRSITFGSFAGVDMGDGDDVISITRNFSANILMGNGNDRFTTAVGFFNSGQGSIDMGTGNDIFINNMTLTLDVTMGDGDDDFTNSVDLTGNVFFGTGALRSFDNSGQITGDISLGDGDMNFTNSGTITGDVILNSGNGTFNNTGTITGMISYGVISVNPKFGPNAVPGTNPQAGAGDIVSIVNDGTLSNLGGVAFAMVDDTQITFTNNSTIVGDVDLGAFAPIAGQTQSTLINNGDITGSIRSATLVNAQGATMDATGTFQQIEFLDSLSNAVGGIISGPILGQSSTASLDNAGIINGAMSLNFGIASFTNQIGGVINGDISFFDAVASAGQTIVLTNLGDIVGDFSAGAQTVTFDNQGLFSGNITMAATNPTAQPFSNSSLINSGDITGNILMDGGDDQLTNNVSASITGTVNLGDGNNQINNDGTITGALFAGDGNNMFANRGTITSNVSLGTGNNSFLNADGAFIGGNVQFSSVEGIATNDGDIGGNVTVIDPSGEFNNFGNIDGLLTMIADLLPPPPRGAGSGVTEDGLVYRDRGGVMSDSFFKGDNGPVSGANDVIRLVNEGAIGTANGPTGIVIFGSRGDILNQFGGVINGSINMGEFDDLIQNVDGAVINGNIFMGSGNDGINSDSDINGSVDLGAGDDTFDNAGTLIGNVLLGSGANTFRNFLTVTGNVTGGTGIDNVQNIGTINGNLSLGGGDDFFQNLLIPSTNPAVGPLPSDFNGNIDMGDGDNNLINDANIFGDVTFGNGSDQFNNNGTVTGIILLGAGNDIYDGSGALAGVTVDGEAGDDWLMGGSGNDIIRGGAGNDLLVGSAGADQFDGGAGIDTLDYSASSAAVDVNLLEFFGTGGDANGDDYGSVATIENVIGSDFDDFFTGNSLDNTFFGGAGADAMNGSAGFDTVDYSNGTTGVVLSYFNGGVAGDAAGDTYLNIEQFIGTDFNDSIIGNFDGTVFGGAGNDDISVEGATANLFGEAGDDILRSSTDGNSTLTGGADLDTFVINQTATGSFIVATITDFEDNIDSIDFTLFNLAALGVNNINDLMGRATQIGADVVFNLDNASVFGFSLVVQNTTLVDVQDDIIGI